MTVADYACLPDPGLERADGGMDIRTQRRLSGLSGCRDRPLTAQKDASAAGGPWPLIIYAPSFSAPAWENAELCEYIASFGFVVLACPSLGDRSRVMTLDRAGAEAQARDISFLIGFGETLPNVTAGRTAVIGYSWGGLANVLSAAADPRIQALVSLDGSILFSPGVIAASDRVDLAKFSIPLLSISQGQMTAEDLDRFFTPQDRAAPNVLSGWRHGDKTSVYVHGLAHGEFASMHLRDEHAWEHVFAPWHERKGGDRAKAWEAFGWVARYVKEFLSVHLTGSAEATAFLAASPRENGAPDFTLTVEHRPAAGDPDGIEGLRRLAARTGMSSLHAAVLERRSQAIPDSWSEAELIAWAEDLDGAGLSSEAKALLECAAQLYPSSPEALVSLGDLYLRLSRRAEAAACYRDARTRSADSLDAIVSLHELTSSAIDHEE